VQTFLETKYHLNRRQLLWIIYCVQRFLFCYVWIHHTTSSSTIYIDEQYAYILLKVTSYLDIQQATTLDILRSCECGVSCTSVNGILTNT